MASYGFSVQPTEDKGGQRLKYEFVVDKNGAPKKLGDGTFGAVFHAIGPTQNECAVKLFYPTSSESVTHRRNSHEMRSGSEVRETLRRQRRASLIANLVLSDGWTDSFNKSEAYRSLKGTFTDLGIAVSRYALVMPYYECTLKDLLEIGAPAGRLVADNVAEKPGEPGYEILREMSLPERERHIVGIVEQIVTGLRALHAANLFHRDIKPANVMMRGKGRYLEVALGDFGFLDELPEKDASGYGGALPLGTRHYRSPEQKDYFDLCDVSVRPGGDKEKPFLILETTDKKFADTLIDVGDIAEFSKDKHDAAREETGYRVESVKHFDDKSEIVLENNFNTVFKDEKTQVIFYKKPSSSTDIFGIGALIFDMLTLGKSPECFYDYLRPFDHSANSGYSVTGIVDKYIAAINSTTLSADLAPIFDQVRDGALGHYPSQEIMGIILRCMMSRAAGSYIHDQGKQSLHNLFERILKDLAKIPSLRMSAEMSPQSTDAPPQLLTTNPLWKGGVAKGTATERALSFETVIAATYGYGSGKKRLIAGTRLLSQIYETVEKIVRQEDFFVDIGPNNLRFSDKNTAIRPIIETYRDEEDYIGAVLSGVGWSSESGGGTDRFIPLYKRFTVRAVSVYLEEVADDGTTIQARVSYTQSLPIWRKSAKGDFVRIVDISGNAALFAITKIEGSGALMNVEAERVSSGEEFSIESGENENEEINGILIRRLDPDKYYLSMLATYIQHLFFVNRHGDVGGIPEETWGYLRNISSGKYKFFPLKRTKLANLPFQSKPTSQFGSVRLDLATLYLECIGWSEGDSHSKNSNLIAQVKGQIDLIMDRIAKSIGYEDRNHLLSSVDRNVAETTEQDSEDNDKKEFSDYLKDVMK